MFLIVLGVIALIVISIVMILALCKIAGRADDQSEREYEKIQSRGDNDGDN